MLTESDKQRRFWHCFKMELKKTSHSPSQCVWTTLPLQKCANCIHSLNFDQRIPEKSYWVLPIGSLTYFPPTKHVFFFERRSLLFVLFCFAFSAQKSRLEFVPKTTSNVLRVSSVRKNIILHQFTYFFTHVKEILSSGLKIASWNVWTWHNILE